MHFCDNSPFLSPSSLALISLTFVTHDIYNSQAFLGKMEHHTDGDDHPPTIHIKRGIQCRVTKSDRDHV
jgi:hypothetical protein